jgi:disulfide bond formation protein DsbB
MICCLGFTCSLSKDISNSKLICEEVFLHPLQTWIDIVTCAGGTCDEMTGSSLDDWILLALRLQPFIITLGDSVITLLLLHTFYKRSSH